MASWSVRDIPSQAGRFAIVTGATGGIGYETALELVRAGADVVVASRSEAKGAAAIARIRAVLPGGSVSFEVLDLASLDSVAGLAERMKVASRAIDILINNAGVMGIPHRQVTADGFEMQFGTNFLGHFALTARLLPLIQRAARPRIVQVSSGAHRAGKIALDDLQAERRYGPWRAYGQSKLADLLFALELHRRSEAGAWNIHSTAAHPGWAKTDLQTSGPGHSSLIGRMSKVVNPLLSQSAARGALPTLYAATYPDLEGGTYVGPGGFMEMRGAPKLVGMSDRAKDAGVATSLWEAAEQLTGVTLAPGLPVPA